MNTAVSITLSTFVAVLTLSYGALAQADLTAPAPDTGSVTAPDNGTKDLTPVQRPMAELNAPQSDLQISAWVDHPDNSYTVGDNVVVNAKSNQDGYLTILDVGTSGKVHIIFPNHYQQDNRIPAGQVIQVPGNDADFNLQVQGPAGTELIKVIVTKDPHTFFQADSTEPAGPYKALKKSAPTVAKDLAVVLREQHSGQWAEYDKKIQIVAPVVTGQTPPPAAPALATSGTYAASSMQPAADLPMPFELHLRTEKLVYPLGSKVRVMATVERDCRLTLLNVGTSGKAHVLFPNRYQQDNRVRAGETVTIPSEMAVVDYQLSGPTGVEALIGICRTDEEPVYAGNYNFQQHVYQPWGDAQAVAKDLAVVLREPSPSLAHTATTFLVVEP